MKFGIFLFWEVLNRVIKLKLIIILYVLVLGQKGDILYIEILWGSQMGRTVHIYVIICSDTINEVTVTNCHFS